MIEYVIEHQTEILLALTSIVTGASIIVKLTPTPKDDVAVGYILKVLQILAFNKGK